MSEKKADSVATFNRRGNDRRGIPDRRRLNTDVAGFAGEEKRQVSRRVKVERRRQIDPTTCERDYSGDEIEFMRAMDDYKRRSGRQFPTWSEVLEVVRSLGYVRPAQAVTPGITG
ncbi:MAG: hypothetical protein HZA46_21640 [Planctomycetales bacterium]|nr:hypothetical protein [Planctomycetales bacterium]